MTAQAVRAGNPPRFQVIPAVDVVGSEAVRLRQGAFDDVVARGGPPEELVAGFAETRPPFVHVVDLDGARSGRIQPELVRRLAEAAAPTPVQASGVGSTPGRGKGSGMAGPCWKRAFPR